MAVTVAEIRLLLNNLTTDLVSDSVVQTNIDLATTYIDAVKSSSADSSLTDEAIKLKAVVLTLLSYSTAVERISGNIPTTVINQANEYEDILNDLIKGIKGQTSVVFEVQTTESLRDEAYDV